MKNTLTPQQTAFFTKNGYIEFEMDLDAASLFESARRALAARLHSGKSAAQSAVETYAAGRDLWRAEPALQTFLLRKLAPIAQTLLNQKALRLGCDQWIPSGYPWEKADPCKELFSIQGLALGLLLCETSVPLPTRRSPLGILPLPAKAGNILFFEPRLILDWPQLSRSTPTDLYLATYALSNAVYIQNPKDPSTNFLKQFGYSFGDPLKNEFHPLLRR